MGVLQNWAGNYTYNTTRLHEPTSVDQVQQLMHQLNHVRVLGTRHSFNGIADSTNNLISLRRLDRVLALDREKHQVTVEAGIKYGDLCRYLHKHQFAIANMASLPHISIAGACATATHGSGDHNSCLATSVRAIEMVKSDGEVVSLSRDQHDGIFSGVVVGLGALGVTTKLTLDIIPEFQMRQYVYENLPLNQLEYNLDDIFSSAYSVSLFTDWRNDTFNQVWLKCRLSDDDIFDTEQQFYGAVAATSNCHPVIGCATENCTEQLGVNGPSFERLPHFRMDFTPSNGEELQSEYIIPRTYAYDALCAISQISEQIAPLLLISEVRTIDEDPLWMSPFYRQQSVAIHFTWKNNWQVVKNLLPIIEQQLAPYNARPHWGKLFTISSLVIPALYERLPDFVQLLTQYDPEGKLRNEFIHTYLFSNY